MTRWTDMWSVCGRPSFAMTSDTELWLWSSVSKKPQRRFTVMWSSTWQVASFRRSVPGLVVSQHATFKPPSRHGAQGRATDRYTADLCRVSSSAFDILSLRADHLSLC